MKRLTAIVSVDALERATVAAFEAGASGVTAGTAFVPSLHQTAPGALRLREVRRMDVLCIGDDVEPIASAIFENAGLPPSQSGKIVVETTFDVVRVRTGERGENAI